MNTRFWFRLLLTLVIVLPVFDVMVGSYIYQDANRWCLNHVYYKTPGPTHLYKRGWSEDKIAVLEARCHHSALHSVHENTGWFPISHGVATNRLPAAEVACRAVNDRLTQFMMGQCP